MKSPGVSHPSNDNNLPCSSIHDDRTEIGRQTDGASVLPHSFNPHMILKRASPKKYSSIVLVLRSRITIQYLSLVTIFNGGVGGSFLPFVLLTHLQTSIQFL